jgi:hypothetical protein
LRIKQGALDFNAHLINRLREDPTDEGARDLLFLNLTKLAKSADLCIGISQREDCELFLRDNPPVARNSSSLADLEQWLIEDLQRKKKRKPSVTVSSDFVITI